MPRACLIAFVFLTAAASADEIVRRSEVVRGTLAMKAGALELRGEGGKVIAFGAELRRVSLASTAKTFRGGPPHVVALSDEEHLTGVFVGVDKGAVVLRTAWAERVAVPRDGLVSLTHLPGWRTLVREDFAGKPTLLTKAEQAVAAPVEGKVVAGRVGVLFQDAPAKSSWAVEAEFATRIVRVRFADDSLTVDPGGLLGTAYPVKRSAEARKLTLAFSPASLRIACDDSALWHSPDLGPGALKGVRIVHRGGDGKVEIRGVYAEVAEPVRRYPPGDPKRDEIRLAGGDQLFGDVKRADARGVEIEGKFGTRSYAWKELRGWLPRRIPIVAGKPSKGIAVRLEIHSGLRAERDVLRGVLTALDAKSATFHHRSLGELIIPRASIASVEEVAPP
jgi:hypothetical protein